MYRLLVILCGILCFSTYSSTSGIKPHLFRCLLTRRHSKHAISGLVCALTRRRARMNRNRVKRLNWMTKIHL